MSILLFLLVLFTLVLVHEWGHFIVAKLTGMRVDEFGIGFPPKLFGIKKGETEYTFNALPIGGFVRILGEDPTQVHEDSNRSFSSKSKVSQALVLIAGITMNILFAWFLFIIIFTTGVPTTVEESQASDAARLIVTSTVADSPASVLPVGSEITSVSYEGASDSTLSPSELISYIKNAQDYPITITYLVGDEERVETLTPTTGIIPNDEERLALGVSFSFVENVSYPLHTAIAEATVITVTSLRDITIGLFSLLAGAFTGTADFTQVAGPVGIVGLVGDAAQFGLTSLLMFTAIISLNLAVINLLPFPALDGGRLLFVAIETVTKKEINPIWVSRLNTVGFGLLMFLMIVITYNDILRLL